MNSFKFAFKTIQQHLLHRQHHSIKTVLIFNNKSQLISTSSSSSKFLFFNKKNLFPKKTIISVQINKCFHSDSIYNSKLLKNSIYYNNNKQLQKWLSTSLLRFNESTSARKIVEDEKKEEEKVPPKTKSWFGRRFGHLLEKEHSWKLYSGLFMFSCISGLFFLILEWGAPRVDEMNLVVKDEYTDLPAFLAYPKRALFTSLNYYQMFKDPTSDKLLPEPLQEPYYQPLYTLVIELTGVLVHPEWTIANGWRYKKRPGLEYFLEQVKYPLFEVVLFTNEPSTTMAPTVAALDPHGNIQFKLFRDCTKYQNNQHIKDLKYLNRDPKKIIVIDWDEKAYQLQPRNALHRLKKFKGEDEDTDLVYLASFLKFIATSGVDDVREVLDYYNGENDPLEAFKINFIKYQEEEEKKKRDIEEAKKKQFQSGLSGGVFSFLKRK